jgi:hypothetical protein
MDLTIIFYVWYNQNKVQSLWSINLEVSSVKFYFEMYNQHIPMGYNWEGVKTNVGWYWVPGQV